MRWLFFTLIMVLVNGCASTSQVATCDQRDWYELGRKDGLQGAPLESRLNEYRRECGSKIGTEWETVYTNGRNAGLIEYCSEENAYEMGRAGIAYLYVCPSSVEATFLKGYRRGQAAFNLEKEVKELDAQIDQISKKIVETENRFERSRLTTELEELQAKRQKNERELTRITR